MKPENLDKRRNGFSSRRLAVDLHIHTALSPCADNDMTPNNIVNMALIKGLDAIAITDHNCTKNVKAVVECADDKDILVVPAVEVMTNEEVHLLCYFEDMDMLSDFGEYVYYHLPETKNEQGIFGQQLIMDSFDQITGNEEKMLLNAINAGIYEVADRVNTMGGACVPAHADRNSYSIISNLGSIPEDLCFKYVEYSADSPLESDFKRYKRLIGSDAHDLSHILEPCMFMELKEKRIKCIIQELKN